MKTKLFRLLDIARHLCDHEQGALISDIASHFIISERTVFRYIKELRGFGIIISIEGGIVSIQKDESSEKVLQGLLSFHSGLAEE